MSVLPKARAIHSFWEGASSFLVAAQEQVSGTIIDFHVHCVSFFFIKEKGVVLEW